jgi:cytochrome c biogenesis protein CcdA
VGPETYALGFLAGMLSILSPCVLPLVPIVFGTAAGEHRWGPLALATGLVISFVSVGLFVATLGYAAGIEGEDIRWAGGVLMATAGIVLVIPPLGSRLARLAAPAGDWIGRHVAPAGKTAGLHGQLSLGLVLGVVWSPCVGPTLGAASVLAARGQDLGQVAVVMTAFGIGTALPLALIGLASREALSRWRGRMLRAGSTGKYLLGGILLLVGVLILTGWDKRIEAWAVEHSPSWLTWLTTSV